MEKHLLIGKGCKGWGGPLTITPGQGWCVHHRDPSPVVDHLSELTGWPSIDVFKNGEPPAERLWFNGHRLRRHVALRTLSGGGIPTLTCIPPVKRPAGGIYGSTSRRDASLREMVWPQGEAEKLGIVAGDLTGATTVRVLLARSGLKTTVSMRILREMR